MEKEFVPFNLAVKLKELGFDEPCFCTYHNGELSRNPSNKIDSIPIKKEPYTWKNSIVHNTVISAPLWQQCFDWFTNKNYHSYIEGSYPWFRYYINTESDRYEGFKHLKPQEARQACLEKLIELVEIEKYKLEDK